ncbi:hypothetical protein Tco_0249153 [Tanacetum coccineum]
MIQEQLRMLRLLLLHLPNNSFEIQQMPALLEDIMNIRMSRLEKAISEKNATTPATIKAVEEVCVTCGSNHTFNNCPLTRNEFPVFHDNIHQFQQTAAVGNFVKRNPPNLANQMRPPGFQSTKCSKQPNKPKPISRKQFQFESKPWKQFQSKPSKQSRSSVGKYKSEGQSTAK